MAEEHLTEVADRAAARLGRGRRGGGARRPGACTRRCRATRPVWIVDPVDGTRQFVHGEPGFCTLVALAQHGEVLASWTYAPALRRDGRSPIRGRGATLNGAPLRAGSPAPGRGARGGDVPPGLHHRRTRSAPCSACGRDGVRARALRLGGPGVSGRRPRASWTRWPSPGRTPGTTRRACSWSTEAGGAQLTVGGRAVPHHGRQRAAVHGGPGRGDGATGPGLLAG